MIAPFDITGIRIETERLVLRPWTMDDLADFHAYAVIPEIGRMAGWKPHESMEESRQVLEMFIEGKRTFAMVHKASGRVIGSLGIEIPDPDPERELQGREIGYTLHKDFWGQGLVPEATKAVIRYCFDVLHYDYLICCHFDWNHQSRRVIEKCGFRQFSTTPYDTRFDTVEQSMNYILYNKE